ncbi:hypothetical protein ACFXJ5_11975 [Streptomyces sp. NPDC059373]
MISALSQAAGKVLGGARFSLINVLPVSVLAAFVAALASSGAYSGGDVHMGALFLRLGDHPGWSAAGAFGLLLAGVLLRPFQIALVQILEGYWSGRFAVELAADLAIERHRRRLNTAEVLSDSAPPPEPTVEFGELVTHARRKRRIEKMNVRGERTVLRYPAPVFGTEIHGGGGSAVIGDDDRLMPTMLGNVLRDGEDASGRRYGLDLQWVAHRLYPQLSPKLDTAITQQLDLLDSIAALCVCFGLATAAGLPLLFRLDVWSLLPVATVLLVASAYRGALRVASAHAGLLATAFDLHRFDMLAALHVELPVTPEREYELNVQLSEFFSDRGALAKRDLEGLRYVHPTPRASGSPPDDGDTSS